MPIYLQIMELIKRDIVTQKFKGGDKLPSVREMAETLRVNPNTIQRVYQELEREKVTFTQRGMGTFITADETVLSSLRQEMAQSVITSFLDGMKNLGFSSPEIRAAVSEFTKEDK